MIFIHGVGGCGKSLLINLLCDLGEYYFRKIKPGDLKKPVTLKTAPTGKAASNINGQTLHTAFNLPFGNKDLTLNDETRHKLRTKFEYLKILFIDEISMVKPDILYQIDRRLRVIKGVPNKLFGNVCVVILSDLMQLRKIKASYTFGPPTNMQFLSAFTIAPLFDEFQIVELTTNHRQGSDAQYAELLKRVRMGEHTDNDIAFLQTHIVKEDDPKVKDALWICGTNPKVNTINQTKLMSLEGNAPSTFHY